MTARAGRLVVRCPAKVNLHLEVLGRRPDGYHEVRTLLAAVGVWDTLIMEPGDEGVGLEVRPAGVAPAGEDNLVVRAARQLQRRSGTRLGARLILHKRIPVAGGMGGGSSNAAAALVGLNQLWGLGAGLAELQAMASALGADVPFFLLGGVAWGTGRGDELQALPNLPPWWVVLLPGPVPVSTAEVYASLGAPPLRPAPPSPIYDCVRRGGSLPLESCRNDLEPAVMERFPEVRERLEALAGEHPRLAMLSGSGGTVFALLDDEAGARACAGRCAGRGALVAPLLTREASQLRPLAGEETWKLPMSGSP
jgi:4-diphosphocytidyl-2-C-methyl-D-erythritol kinase